MTWTLRVSNGDLVIKGDSFETVSNENKLVQDLRHYLLERMGSDPNYPWYGSLIDGGIKADGTMAESVIARTDWFQVELELEAEIRRIAATYQRQQIERAKRDRQRYGKSTLTAGEILLGVSQVQFRQVADQMYVVITVQSARNTATDLTITMPASVNL